MKSVEKGSEAGLWNIVVEMNLNKAEHATMGIYVSCFNKEVGSFSVNARRAHKLDKQTVAPNGMGKFYIDSVLEEEGVAVDSKLFEDDRYEYGVVKDDGSFELSFLQDENYTIGPFTESTTQINDGGEPVVTVLNGLAIEDFGFLSTGHNYSFLVRFQRTANESDGYVWVELPVACKVSE